jgi:uncharacterized protein (DUF736 family)
MNIGEFERRGPGYQGRINCRALRAKNVRIVPNTGAISDNGPTHRVYDAEGAEIGAGWAKRSEDRDYLSVKLDDPSFTQPIYASLFDDPNGKGANLVWSRPRPASE